MLVKIPKKQKGQFRLIYVPNDEEKTRLRALMPQLNELQVKLCAPCVHGFIPRKSPITNALEHKNFAFTISFDLSNFFDTVTEGMVRHLISPEILSQVFINGHTYQGLPTSPAIANLAAIGLDAKILQFCANLSEKVIYTRYADDLTFSCNNYATINALRENIPQLIVSEGFTINVKKTRIQSAKFGNRVITGVRVGKDGICAGRNLKRRIRAAQHSGKDRVANGLAEWAKMRKPSTPPHLVKKIIEDCVAYLGVLIKIKLHKKESIGDLSWKFDHLRNQSIMTHQSKTSAGLAIDNLKKFVSPSLVRAFFLRAHKNNVDETK